ncbi:MAG: ABC transporter substrate binding protein [Candidatus Thiodiazotropha sp.]
MSGNAPVYERVANAAKQRIKAECNSSFLDCKNLAFTNVKLKKATDNIANDALLTVTLGTKASKWADQSQDAKKTIRAMLPYDLPKNTPVGAGNSTARLYIDQPYKRYFDLIKTTTPRLGRVGLLIHENHLSQVDLTTDIANSRGLTLKTSIVSAERSVGEALSYLLDDIDVLLALPDSRIHNSQTISHILTTAYRNNIPVFGFSSAYVKAGAIAAVYTSPEDIAHQISDTVINFLNHDRFDSRSQQASYFSVSFNFEVARSLGLPPISPSEIKKTISQGNDK